MSLVLETLPSRGVLSVRRPRLSCYVEAGSVGTKVWGLAGKVGQGEWHVSIQGSTSCVFGHFFFV